MWSPYFYYLNIVHDLELSVYCNTGELIRFLNTLPELQQIDSFQFKSAGYLPFSVDMLLLNARSYSSWSDLDTDLEKTNLIAMVCTKNTSETFEQAKGILIKVAAFQNWQLINEYSDNDIEDDVIWGP